ncbi:hypothetical protein [Pseudomonas phage PhiPizzaParty]|nr:hypothetical protein [Pseudomonas phage PhiPizzaParty]
MIYCKSILWYIGYLYLKNPCSLSVLRVTAI